MPIAVISAASRGEPRNGRYATRSSTQPYMGVSTMVTINTMTMASGTETQGAPEKPSRRNMMIEMKAPIMNISP